MESSKSINMDFSKTDVSANNWEYIGDSGHHIRLIHFCILASDETTYYLKLKNCMTGNPKHRTFQRAEMFHQELDRLTLIHLEHGQEENACVDCSNLPSLFPTSVVIESRWTDICSGVQKFGHLSFPWVRNSTERLKMLQYFKLR